MKILLPLAMFVLMAITASAQHDLFFSEYVEGSGNNKALEIYNPTKDTIDLKDYYVERFSNGLSTYTDGGITHLVGKIAPFQTFVLVNGQTVDETNPPSPKCSPVLQALANQLDHKYPAPTYMNGNDAIALVKTTNGAAPLDDNSNTIPVDLFGQVGLGSAIYAETGWSNIKDTTVSYKSSGVQVTGKVINYIVQAKATDGSHSGPFWLAWSANHSLIRKYDVMDGVKGNQSPFVITKEWDTLQAVIDTAGHRVYEDIWTNLGHHDCKAKTLGMNDIPATLSLSIYPNPVVADRFTISSSQPVTEVEIFSVIGCKMYQQTVKKGQQQIEIGPFDLGKGMYLVRISNNKQTTAVKKILVK